MQPGTSNNNPILSPSQLGYSGGFSGLFGGSKTETAPFKGEPTRDSLTQPPPGYQTPSSNFAYGTGPKESLNKEYNPAATEIWRIVKLISRLRDDCRRGRGVRCRGFIPNGFVGLLLTFARIPVAGPVTRFAACAPDRS